MRSQRPFSNFTMQRYQDRLEIIQTAPNLEFSQESVPATLYFGMANDKIVGTIQIRHKLSQRLLKTYGHIGYGVRPSERRKGYASKMLALALEKCKELRIDNVLISCDKDNIASSKTILKNGGNFDKEFAEEDGNIVKQYWITL